VLQFILALQSINIYTHNRKTNSKMTKHRSWIKKPVQ